MNRKPLIIIYFLLFYASAQLIWWSLLLINYDPARRPMIFGEALVFLVLIAIGAHKIRQSYKESNLLSVRQGNFLLSVTHELKSPLASIKLYIETILMRNLDKDRRDTFLKNSLRDIDRLHDLLENMLLATRYDNDKDVRMNDLFDFSESTQNIIHRLQQNVCHSRVIEANITPNIMMKGDMFALSSVVSNLIENALKYSPQCEQVLVDLEESKNNVILRVSDTGIGISDEEKYRIFDKFYRVGNENTRSTKGTGLGLYIVKQVLSNHNGYITVRNNTPKGSIFEVIFEKNVE